MNVTTSIITTHFDTFHMNLDICRLEPFLEIGASSSIALESEYCAQTISFIIASFIGLFSMLYRIIYGAATDEKVDKIHKNIAATIESEPEYESEPVESVNELFEMFVDSDDDEPETEAVQSVNELFGMFMDECDSDDDDIEAIALFPSLLASQREYCVQTISLIIASTIALFSSLYDILAHYLWQLIPGFRLHFVGIGRPQSFNGAKYKLLDNINTENTMITIQTPLKCEDSIFTLKQVIRNIYCITDSHDILILFAHHIISHDEQRTLKEIGITNNSLLTLAICDNNKCVLSPQLEPQLARETEAATDEKIEEIIAEIVEIDVEPEYESESESEANGNEINAMFEMYVDYESETEPVESVNELFGMFANEYASDDDIKTTEVVPTEKHEPPTWPRFGFDIITQEHDVMVHKMPVCGHEMNAESLYQYALNTFHDSSNLHLNCPHKKAYPQNNVSCDAKWDYSVITDILRYDDDANTKKDENKWKDYAKLELLSSRNVIENKCNVQKCPRCNTLYYKNYDETAQQLGDIKTVEDIEKEFKFKCILCPEQDIEIEPEALKAAPKQSNIAGAHNEDDIEEDIDGDAVNILFGMQDDESDDEADADDDNREALIAIAHMFDDDEPDEEPEIPLNEFCFCCGAEWSLGHICSSSFRDDLVEILAHAEGKRIGSVDEVPSIRCCPQCAQLIFHVDACKHIQCTSCKTNFCFVCLKERRKKGGWQCGSHADICPVADKQDKNTLPDTIVITKKSFKLF